MQLISSVALHRFRVSARNDIGVSSILKSRDLLHELSALVYEKLVDLTWNDNAV